MPDAAGSPAEKAYADLVGAVLDLRTPSATATFDTALAEAVDAGALSPELARRLRWLQRESVRVIVEHAANVLPATLTALEASRHEPVATSPNDEPASATVRAPEDAAGEAPEPADPPADLTARRLLVAGLRPIPDRPFP